MKLIPLVQAVEKATGCRPHLSTVLRWCNRHNRYGNRLKSKVVGGRRLTSIQWVLEYIDANTSAAEKPRVGNPCHEDQMPHRKAMKELDNAGI